MNNNYDIYTDEFLAKWMSDELSAEEMKAFESHPDYATYVKMKAASNSLSFSTFNKEEAFQNIRQKTKPVVSLNNTGNKAKAAKKPIWKYLATGIAAAVLLLFGFIYSSQNTIYNSNAGEQLSVSLPDQSEVLLNSNSEISFHKKQWHTDRKVNLKGEAFFKVEKGERFLVESAIGKVQVLGTQFSVNALGEVFIVKCFEGRVGVSSGTIYKEITPGMAIQIKKDSLETWQFEREAPTWATDAISSFRKIPVKELLIALKRQYQITIEGTENLNQNEEFTGSFSNTNLKEAAHTIFTAMNANYTLDRNSKIIILKK